MGTRLAHIPASVSGRELFEHWLHRRSLWWDGVAKTASWAAYQPNRERGQPLATTSDYRDASGKRIWEGGGWNDETQFFLELPSLLEPAPAWATAPEQGDELSRPQFIPC